MTDEDIAFYKSLGPDIKKFYTEFLDFIVEAMRDMKVSPYDINIFIAHSLRVEEKLRLGEPLPNKLDRSKKLSGILNYRFGYAKWLLVSCESYQNYLKEYEDA